MYKLVGAAFFVGVFLFVSEGDLLIASLLGVCGVIWAATTPVFRQGAGRTVRSGTTLRLR